MNRIWVSVAGLAAVMGAAGAPASAAVVDLSLTGSASGFSESQFDFLGAHFDQFTAILASDDFPVTVSQGDTVNTTVTFDGLVSIPASQIRTDLVQNLSSETFPAENTEVAGTYDFYDGATLVESFSFDSTTSGALSTFTPLFPPANVAFSFDSYTDDFTVVTLPTPATLDNGYFSYSLLSTAVPEPAAWTLMLLGLATIGAALRGRRRGVLAV